MKRKRSWSHCQADLFHGAMAVTHGDVPRQGPLRGGWGPVPVEILHLQDEGHQQTEQDRLELHPGAGQEAACWLKQFLSLLFYPNRDDVYIVEFTFEPRTQAMFCSHTLSKCYR